LELANDGPRGGLEAVLDGSMEETGIAAFPAPIRALHLTKGEAHLIVGLESGEMRILAQVKSIVISYAEFWTNSGDVLLCVSCS
jgi:hypothetical protein